MIGLVSVAGGFVWLVIDKGFAGLVAGLLLVSVLLGASALADWWRR